MNRIWNTLSCVAALLFLYCLSYISSFHVDRISINQCDSDSISCPVRCSSFSKGTENAADSRQILTECKDNLIEWVSNYPSSTYRYYDRVLNHLDFFREFEIARFLESDDAEIRKTAQDIHALLQAIYFRGQPPPTLQNALAKGLILPRKISDLRAKYVIEALECNEHLDPILLRKREETNVDSLIGSLNSRMLEGRKWLETDASSFLFLNTMAQAEVCKIYLTYDNPSFAARDSVTTLKKWICSADSLIFLTWRLEDLEEFKSPRHNGSGGNDIKICFPGEGGKKDSILVDVPSLKRSRLACKLQAYFNNKCEVLSWMNIVSPEESKCRDAATSTFLDEEQIALFSQNIANLSLVPLDRINSYITLAEYYSVLSHMSPEQSRHSEACHSFLESAAVLLHSRNVNYDWREEILNYVRRSRFLDYYFTANPGLDFIDIYKSTERKKQERLISLDPMLHNERVDPLVSHPRLGVNL